VDPITESCHKGYNQQTPRDLQTQTQIILTKKIKINRKDYHFHRYIRLQLINCKIGSLTFRMPNQPQEEESAGKLNIVFLQRATYQKKQRN
jgi:hypothetical protein